jgi:Cdc6-like AAA superfamily ATPase
MLQYKQSSSATKNLMFAAMYINVEKGRNRPFADAMQAIIDSIRNELQLTFGTDFMVGARIEGVAPESKVELALQHISSALSRQGRRFVLLWDEIDSLEGDTLYSLLRYAHVIFFS